MPKLDTFTSGIEGWATMTAEQKLEALAGIDFPEAVDLSGHVPKAQFDRVSSELAAAKKASKEKMTADEAAAAQAAEELKAALEGKQTAEKKLAIMEHTAEYMKLGYEPDLAKEAAEALFGGDTAKLFEIQQKFNAAQQQKFKTELEKKQFPGGSGGSGATTDPAVAFAQSRAKAKNESAKAADESMKHYF